MLPSQTLEGEDEMMVTVWEESEKSRDIDI